MNRSKYLDRDIQRELFRLGITMRYIGYHDSEEAVL